MAIFVGTSGWSYDHWQGVLYPNGTSVRDRLQYYVPHYRTVEINSTYYRWPRDAAFASWRRSYSHDDLSWWADRAREWARQDRDVYLYFNNDGGGNAVHNAATLRHFLAC